MYTQWAPRGGSLYNDCVEGQGGTDAMCAKYCRIKANHVAVPAALSQPSRNRVKREGAKHWNIGVWVYGWQRLLSSCLYSIHYL